MSVSRYNKIQEIAEGPRAGELRILSQVTGMLVDGAARGGRALVEACYYNRKLWSIFLADLANPDNGLPDATKASLVSLGIWVQKYTGSVLVGAPVQPLVDVNRSIMDGLRPAAAPPASTVARPSAVSA